MSKTFCSTPIHVAALLALCVSSAHAADAQEFLRMVEVGSVGKAIPGESTAIGHQGWTAVDGIAWEVKAETSWLKGTGVAVDKPSVPQFHWRQALDTTVPSMYQNIVRGTALTSASFDYVGPGSTDGSPYLSLGLKQAAFTGLSMSIAGISAAVSAKELALSYNAAPSDTASQPITTSWDIAKLSTPVVPILRPDTALVGHGLTPAAAPGGATQAYLRLGKDVAGNSQAKGYENWIPVNTAGWDVLAESGNGNGGVGAGTVGKPTPGPLTWTQGLDATLLVSLAKIAGGTGLSQATLEFVKNAGAGPVTFMQLAMNDVYFTSVGVDGLQATESVVFKSASETLWRIKADGTRDDNGVRFDYNVANPFSTIVPHTQAVAGFGLGNLSPKLSPPIGDPQPGGIDQPGIPGPVPEPQTWVLMIGGGALLLGVARRRRLERP